MTVEKRETACLPAWLGLVKSKKAGGGGEAGERGPQSPAIFLHDQATVGKEGGS